MKKLMLAGVLSMCSSMILYAQDAQEILRKSFESTRFNLLDTAYFKYHSISAVLQNYQSDRSYPPFFSAFYERENIFDHTHNVEFTNSKMVFPTQGPGQAMSTVTKMEGSFMSRSGRWFPIPSSFGGDAYLNPVRVLKDWMASPDVTQVDDIMFRDYRRTTLRKGEHEYLLLDKETLLPVKYETVTNHDLWGPVKLEYIYSTWWLYGPVYFPAASFKIVDGVKETSRTHGSYEFVAKNLVKNDLPPEDVKSTKGAIEPPKTEQLTSNLYLLKNRMYTSAIYKSGNTLYLLDATQSETRAKLDHELIKEVFPNTSKLVLVVTDLAWPHIGGMRYWISQGAQIISHQDSEAFLRKVYEKKWQANPDRLESKRSTSPLNFIGISQATTLGGNLQIVPLQGVSSEGAIVVYLKEENFLWASDYIQPAKEPNAYATEVWKTLHKESISPDHMAAQHMPVTSWQQIEETMVLK